MDPSALIQVKRDGCLSAETELFEDQKDVYKLLVSRTTNIEAIYLFTTHSGFFILKDICTFVTSVAPSLHNTSYKDLAVKLKYSPTQVKCLENCLGAVFDPTEKILEFYADKGGLVSEIFQGLFDLKFFAALHKVESHINNFIAEVNAKKAVPFHGANTKDTKTRFVEKTHIKTCDAPAVFNTLLSKTQFYEDKNKLQIFTNNAREIETYQRSTPSNRIQQGKNYCKFVILSFAADGHETALKVAATLRGTTNKQGSSIGVLLLCENEDLILSNNPGRMIPELLSKMSFVIPILTEGYFNALKRPHIQTNLLDERYVKFIHDTLVNKYINDNCLNLQVRPVIPQQFIESISRRDDFKYNTLLSAWKSDCELPALARNIIKARSR